MHASMAFVYAAEMDGLNWLRGGGLFSSQLGEVRLQLPDVGGEAPASIRQADGGAG